MANVAVLYTHYPHYRGPVFQQLVASKIHNFELFFDDLGVDETILTGKASFRYRSIKSTLFKKFIFQGSFAKHVLIGDYQAYIFLGNPYILTNWIWAIVARIRGRKTLFWTHGWLTNENSVKDKLRSIFYRLADHLLLYGERAKRLGHARGFDSDAMTVIYNSLDFDAQSQIRERLLVTPEGSHFLCVSRLIDSVELELAIRALAILNENNQDRKLKLVIVGDGPARCTLEKLANDSDVEVVFLGSIYEEEELAELFMSCIAVVSPGKVGLLTMHALAYGAPVISHGTADFQMPEFEAIEDGVTGSFYIRGNAKSLAEAMQVWTSLELREKAIKPGVETIGKSYRADLQVNLIEGVITSLLEDEK